MKSPKRNKACLLIFGITFFLTACGYKASSKGDNKSCVLIEVPQIKGDKDGAMVSMLINSLSLSPHFRYVADRGKLILDIEVKTEKDDTIGFQYDHTRSGNLINRLVPSEARRELVAKVTVFDANTHENIGVPFEVSASADYDFSNFDTYQDLSFITPDGTADSSLAFSLGQLNTKPDAKQGASQLLYKKLAEKIVLGLSALIANEY